MGLGLGLSWFTVAGPAAGADPEVSDRELPRVLPTEPGQAAGTFRVKRGFRLDLVAAEPLVVDPIALSFDEEGRLYVVEMRDYSERRAERLGRIRRLEDTDGDGHYDTSTVFAEGLPWPTGVICWNGGVFVASTPDILYLKDTAGRGTADVREVIFTGFAADYAPYATNKLNVQAMLNSFQWSLENRIHGVTSFNGGRVRRVDSAFVREWLKPRGNQTAPADGTTPLLDLRGRDFSFDPRDLELRAESGGGQYGMSFDNHGRKFVCSNSSHLQAMLYEERYAARNSFLAMPRSLADVAVDGGAAPVFRISPDEPWRVIRTRWRVSGAVPGLVEGGGRPSGYFTGATGVTIYRGNSFPPDMVGDAFVADCGSNLIHRKKVRPDGLSVRGERPPDEQTIEFLASTDNWFRPVQMANAPDGTLYVCDMYREIIEHPWSLPPTLKKHLDLNSGNDRGRIYRVVPEGFRQPERPRLGTATLPELVALLGHPNGWHRDTASRLLCQRQDPAALPTLRRLLTTSPGQLARLHALGVLAALGGLEDPELLAAMTDQSPEVRIHALRYSEPRLRAGSTEVRRAALALAEDPELSVRFQAALSLGELPDRSRIDGLARIAAGRRDGSAPPTGAACDLENPLLRAAIMNSAGEEAAGLLTADLYDRLRARCPGQASREFIVSLMNALGRRQRPAEIRQAIEFIAAFHRGAATAGDTLPDRLAAGWSFGAALGQSLQQQGQSLVALDTDGVLPPLFLPARRTAADRGVPEQTRMAACDFLRFDPAETEAMAVLFGVVGGAARGGRVESPGLQQAALQALGGMSNASMATRLVERWPQLTPQIHQAAVQLLLNRPERTAILLRAVATGRIGRGELDATQVDFLRHHKDAALRAEADSLFARIPAGSREELVQQFRPALLLPGDAEKGRKTFTERCAVCHRLKGLGQVLGPDLVTVRDAGKEKVLVNILDPNREVNSNYLSYEVETRRGEVLSGIIAAESAGSLTLRQAGGTDTTLLRSDLLEVKSQGRSLMPEGLEAGLSAQDLADLLEFVLAP